MGSAGVMTRRAHLTLFAGYFLLACLLTFPLILDLSGQMIGHETGDAYEMGHHIWWFKYALQNGEPLFYQTLMAYPDGLQGISLWANPLQFFPAWALAFVMPVSAAYNLTILLTMALNGWAMAFLLRDLLSRHLPEGDGHGGAAWLAGVVFMAHPVFQGHLFGGHAGLMVMWAVPLLVWALFRLIESPSWGRFGVALAFFLLSPSGHSLQVIYVLMPVMGAFVIGRAWRGDWRGVAWVCGVGVAGVMALGVFLLPVAADTFADDTYTGDMGYIAFSTDLLGLVTPSFGHVIFGEWEQTRRVLGINLIEGYTYAGIIAGGLALWAVVRLREARGWLALAILAAVLALGPALKLYDQPVRVTLENTETYLTVPWAWVYTLPGFSLARTPGRFSFALAVALAVLAGYGAALLGRRLARYGRGVRGGVFIALTALVMFEYQAFFPFPTVRADVPQAIIDLRERDDVRAVMDMPWGNLLAAKDGLYLKTWHQKPQIAGQVTRRTPVSPAKLTVLENTLNPLLMYQAGVDVVILHRRWAGDALNARLRALWGEPYYEDERVALFNVPPASPDHVSPLIVMPGESPDVPVLYFYSPIGDRVLSASGNVRLADGQAVRVRLNGVHLHTLTGDGRVTFDVPVPVADAGYHTLTFEVLPPCPRPIHPAWVCDVPRLNDITLNPVASRVLMGEPVRFEGGITLMGAWQRVDDSALALWWRFESARDDFDVRFVAAVNAEGERVGGDDTPSGRLSAGDDLTEWVTLAFEGEALLYAGWYRYPDLVRYGVPGTVEGWVNLATGSKPAANP